MAAELNRRQFVAAGAALLLCPGGVLGNSRTTGSPPLLYSAASNNRGQHFLCGWRGDALAFRSPVAGRGHDACFHRQRGELIFFARRPGTVIEVLDADSGRHQHRITAAANRHFYGHGCLSADGRYLYTSENAVDRGGLGLIGVYDCGDGYRRINELAAGGIGPHQLALMPDGRRLVVANGGILTLPQRGREKLNLDSMQPALSYIDLASGTISASWTPPDPQLSLRHLAVTTDGSVVVGAQYEGSAPPGELPLVFVQRGDAPLQPLLATAPAWAQHRNYIASVAVSADGQHALTTSPRGSVASLWHLGSGELIASQRIADVAGACYQQQQRRFVVSNGRGQLLAIGATENDAARSLGFSSGLHWDNHLNIIEG